MALTTEKFPNWNKLGVECLKQPDDVFLKAIKEVIDHFEDNNFIDLVFSQKKIIPVSLTILKRLFNLAIEGWKTQELEKIKAKYDQN